MCVASFDWPLGFACRLGLCAGETVLRSKSPCLELEELRSPLRCRNWGLGGVSAARDSPAKPGVSITRILDSVIQEAADLVENPPTRAGLAWFCISFSHLFIDLGGIRF